MTSRSKVRGTAEEETDAIVDAVQRDGTCWFGTTSWHGQRLLRISILNWITTAEDIDRSAEAILRIAAATRLRD